MKKYIAESIATYFLVFAGTGSIVINNESLGAVTHPGIAMSFGLIVTIMIFTFGRISGAHMNPAVTITLTLLKKHKLTEFLPYIFAQLMGAILSSLTLMYLFPKDEFLGTTIPAGTEMQSFILEFILTFLLMIVILFTTSKRAPLSNVIPAVAIGGTVFLEALFAGPICGASMNPARSIAPALVSGHLEHLWLYIVATILGAIVAGFYWRWQEIE